jgi:lysylphosphatidylglycerol synthetase-like protein (DUF2156 family)
MDLGADEHPLRLDPAALERRDALGVLRRHADHSSSFLALNQDTLHYRAGDLDGLIAFRRAGRRHLVQLCGPFAAPPDRGPLLRAFLKWAHEQGRRVTTVQLARADAARYVEAGFMVNQLGSSFSIDLERFTMRGTKFVKLRNKIRRATRLGISVHELRSADLETPSVQAELASIDASWLRAKGRHVKELTFMVGERSGRGARHRRLFLARENGVAVAYVTYSPCFGSRAGWLYDLTRRRPDSPPGTVELVFVTAVAALREEGCRWLHLGLTPFVGLHDEHELRRGSSTLVRQLTRVLSDHGAALYPAHTQERFKLKWGPQLIEPEYVAFEPRPNLAAAWQLLRATHAI